jgi:hypothetical protein
VIFVSILDHFPTISIPAEPVNVAQFTLLQIARSLNDLDNIKTYFALAERCGLAPAIASYRKAVAEGDPRTEFHRGIQQLSNPE